MYVIGNSVSRPSFFSSLTALFLLYSTHIRSMCRFQTKLFVPMRLSPSFSTYSIYYMIYTTYTIVYINIYLHLVIVSVLYIALNYYHNSWQVKCPLYCLHYIMWITMLSTGVILIAHRVVSNTHCSQSSE